MNFNISKIYLLVPIYSKEGDQCKLFPGSYGWILIIRIKYYKWATFSVTSRTFLEASVSSLTVWHLVYNIRSSHIFLF